MQHTFKNRLFRLPFLLFMCFLFMPWSIADDGRLMERFPPNVEADNFELFDLNGNKRELDEFRGKFVLVNFWAMSCNVCKGEMTTLQDAYELLGKKDLIVVSIHAGDDIKGAISVVELNEITYPVLIDADLTLGGWGIPILPTTFLVGPQGNIRYRAVGSRVWNSPFMIDFLQAQLDSSKLKLSYEDVSIH